jgi:selenide, water dikinase
LGGLTLPQNDRVLVDFRTSDDAGVYTWEGEAALVQTVDFFAPIVDDPFVFGQIAAANALSDIYAMGGRPLTALAVAGFPRTGLDHDTIRAIFQGGLDKLNEAGVALLGGHTVQDQEIKFGYAVTGSVDPTRILSNAGARPGDVLLLTKSIGTGVIATALKFDRIAASQAADAVRSMQTLNGPAADALKGLPRGTVHACTDVTGFGLVGHAMEMATASDVTLVVHAGRVPIFPGAKDLASQNQSGGMTSNRSYYSEKTGVAEDIDTELLSLLYDPQTSGGLLIALNPDTAATAIDALATAGVLPIQIGDVRESDPGFRVEIRP